MKITIINKNLNTFNPKKMKKKKSYKFNNKKNKIKISNKINKNKLKL